MCEILSNTLRNSDIKSQRKEVSPSGFLEITGIKIRIRISSFPFRV